MKATKVTAGLAESNGSLLPGLWRDSLHVTCGLTACTPGSAPGPTLGNEYGKTLPFTFNTHLLHCTPPHEVYANRLGPDNKRPVRNVPAAVLACRAHQQFGARTSDGHVTRLVRDRSASAPRPGLRAPQSVACPGTRPLNTAPRPTKCRSLVRILLALVLGASADRREPLDWRCAWI